MYFTARDSDHTAQRDIRVETELHGNVLVSRCATCAGSCWRTPDRFTWSHSKPSRTSWMAAPDAAPRGSFFCSSMDVELTGHLQGPQL